MSAGDVAYGLPHLAAVRTPGITAVVEQPRITREDVRTAVGARRELGEEFEPEVVDAFLERVERTIDARAEQRADAVCAEARRSSNLDGSQLALAIVSLGTGVPITAIAAEQGGVAGTVVAWLGIVGVNVACRRPRG